VKYAFRWRERAVRQLRAIPQPAALTILRALTPLGDDPRRPDANVRKLSGYDDRYRLRVGDYRVIYEVVDGQLVILVVGVGHRRGGGASPGDLPGNVLRRQPDPEQVRDLGCPGGRAHRGLRDQDRVAGELADLRDRGAEDRGEGVGLPVAVAVDADPVDVAVIS